MIPPGHSTIVQVVPLPLSNQLSAFGRHTSVNISTDKVKLASVAKKLFFWKIGRQAVVHRFRNHLGPTLDCC